VNPKTASFDRLPRVYAITGRYRDQKQWWHRFDALVTAGHGLIQLRPEIENHAELEAVAAEAALRCRSAGTVLILNGPVPLVRKLGLPGVHLPSATLRQLGKRPLPAGRLVGASCHTRSELEHASEIGVDFVCLSPVRPTPSHPGAPVLGLARFAELARNCPLPVYALGGMGPENLREVRAAGGYGVAGISAFWA
jgi:thiamine-phosphate diphosphorylase